MSSDLRKYYQMERRINEMADKTPNTFIVCINNMPSAGFVTVFFEDEKVEMTAKEYKEFNA